MSNHHEDRPSDTTGNVTMALLDDFRPEAPATNGTAPAMTAAAPVEQPRRTRWLKTAMFAAAALVVAFGAFLYDPRNLFDAEAVVDSADARDTATATFVSLGDEYSADGTLVFAEPMVVTAVDGGIVTEVVAEARRISRGDVLWRVVDQPVVALFGVVPAYRALAIDTVGTDVHQLEENLVSMGYDPEGTVTVDATFTTNTAAMVERWQTDIDADVTGEVGRGSVVFIPGLSRAGVVDITIGDDLVPGAAALTLTALERVVQFDMTATDRDSLAIGDSITTRLPDRSAFTATVVSAVIGDDGGIAVTAGPDGPVDYLVDTVPVTVSWEVTIGEDVLAVPAAALVRTDSTQYYVEVRSPTGTDRLVAVDVGRASGLLVEVTGDIAEGDQVVSP